MKKNIREKTKTQEYKGEIKMIKDEFLKKHNLTEADYRNLQRFEDVRKSGIYNMYEYFGMMKEHNLNGGKKMVDFIRKDNNYEDFLKTLEGNKWKHIN